MASSTCFNHRLSMKRAKQVVGGSVLARTCAFTSSFRVLPTLGDRPSLIAGRQMLTVYTCITTAHDLRLVGLAAFVCGLASFAAINLLGHAGRSQGHMRRVWLVVSAISTGFGIWATHFIAMLAFTPGIPSAYNVVLTVLSLVMAILLTYAGLAVSLAPNWRHGTGPAAPSSPAALP